MFDVSPFEDHDVFDQTAGWLLDTFVSLVSCDEMTARRRDREEEGILFCGAWTLAGLRGSSQNSGKRGSRSTPVVLYAAAFVAGHETHSQSVCSHEDSRL